MSTTLTSVMHDNVQHKLKDNSMKNLNDIIMDSNVTENNNVCFSEQGFRNSQSEVTRVSKNGRLDLEKKVDLESKLQNRHLELNDHFGQTLANFKDFNLVNSKMCENMSSETPNVNDLEVVNKDTRLTHPIVNYRGMNTSQYIPTPYLHMNPQDVLMNNDKIMCPSRYGTSSRLDQKNDTFKKYKQRKVLNSRDLLPLSKKQ